MKAQPTKFFVVMSFNDQGKLRCCARYEPVTCNDIYAYTSRVWAEKFSAKRPGTGVYCVKGFDLAVSFGITDIRAPLWAIEWHERVRVEAEKQFGA